MPFHASPLSLLTLSLSSFTAHTQVCKVTTQDTENFDEELQPLASARPCSLFSYSSLPQGLYQHLSSLIGRCPGADGLLMEVLRAVPQDPS